MKGSRLHEVWSTFSRFGDKAALKTECASCHMSNDVYKHGICMRCRAYLNSTARIEAVRNVPEAHGCALSARPSGSNMRVATQYCDDCHASSKETQLWACDRCDVVLCNACITYPKEQLKVAAATRAGAGSGTGAEVLTSSSAEAPCGAVASAHFALFHAVAARQPADANVFCSTASLQAAVCIAALAATADSDTATQLLSLFRPGPTTMDGALAATRAAGMLGPHSASTHAAVPGAELQVANALFVTREEGVRRSFADLLETAVGAQVLRARSAADVNAWCAEQTRGAICDVVGDSAVSADTVMLLVNAVLFRGTWRFPFESDLTVAGPWPAGCGTAASAASMVSYMRRSFEKEEELLHAGMVGTGGMARAVRVPYAGAAGLEAWFVLPADSGNEALAAVGAALSELWQEIAALEAAPARAVYLTCPRFTVDSGTMDVVPAMRALGVEAPFVAQNGFQTATDSQEACITAVLHRVTCAVDETGTVAAACTAVECEDGCCPSEEDDKARPFIVRLDRPFWMAIVAARTRVPLFIGRVMQPTPATAALV